MNEPTTVLTDYALAAVSIFLGLKLIEKSKFWAVAFLALGLGALLGGTWHGFWPSEFLWKATTLSVGITSFAMVAGSANAVSKGKLRVALIAFAAVKLLVYTIWMLYHDAFIWVVADTGIALLIVASLYLWQFNGWMLTAVALSILAGLAQASGLRLGQQFNQNDLYHLIQIVAMFAFYHGVKRGHRPR